MARDIEEFLRKAAERRQQQKAGGSPQPQQPAPQQRTPQQPPVRKPLSPENRPPERPLPSRVPVAKPVPVAEPVIVIDQSDIIEEPRLSPNLKSSIDTSSISRHADELGKGVKSVAGRVEDTVNRHLNHNVGKIDDTETITDDPSPKIFGAKDNSAVKELRKLLASKKSVGQAIILSEILKRPDFD